MLWVEIDGQPVNEKMNISNLYKPIELGAFPSQVDFDIIKKNADAGNLKNLRCKTIRTEKCNVYAFLHTTQQLV